MNKQSNWYKKQMKLIDEQHRFDRKIIKKLTDNKDDTQDELIKLINAFIGEHKDELNPSVVRKRISKNDVKRYNRELDKLVKQKDLSPQAKDELKRYRVNQSTSKQSLLEADVNKRLVEMADYEEKALDEAMHQQADNEIKVQGVLIVAALMGMYQLSKSQATARFNKNAKDSEKLINSAIYERRFNTVWSENIWYDTKALRRELNKVIDTAIKTDSGSIAAAKELRKKIGNTKYNTERLVRTELGRIQIETQRYLFLKNNVEQYVVITEKTACEVCLPFDGKVFDVKDMEQGKNAPLFHVMCRCSTASYFDREEWEQGVRERGLYSNEEIAAFGDDIPN